MFKLTQSPTYWQKVAVDMQTEDGRRTTVDFDLQFKRLGQDELREMSDRAKVAADDRVALREVIVGWKRITEDDEDVPFNADNLERVMNAGYTGPMLAAFFASVPSAKAKN